MPTTTRQRQQRVADHHQRMAGPLGGREPAAPSRCWPPPPWRLSFLSRPSSRRPSSRRLGLRRAWRGRRCGRLAASRPWRGLCGGAGRTCRGLDCRRRSLRRLGHGGCGSGWARRPRSGGSTRQRREQLVERRRSRGRPRPGGAGGPGSVRLPERGVGRGRLGDRRRRRGRGAGVAAPPSGGVVALPAPRLAAGAVRRVDPPPA